MEDAVISRIDRKLSYPGLLTPPVKLHWIASACGIEPDFALVPMRQDARLVPRDGKLYIEVNVSHKESKQRFSIAHEISHRILRPNNYAQTWECSRIGISGEKSEEEELCDLGARIILRLTHTFLKPIIDEKSFCLEAVQSVKLAFGVSFEAAIRSVVEITPEEVAVGFCILGLKKSQRSHQFNTPLMPDYVTDSAEELRILRSYCSSTFNGYIPKNKSIPHESCIFVAFSSGNYASATECLSFQAKEKCQYDIQAIARDVYDGNNLRKGVVFLLSNPIKIISEQPPAGAIQLRLID